MIISKFYFFFFLIFFSISVFILRVFGAPPAYLAMYFLSLLLVFINIEDMKDFKIYIPNIVKTLVIFFSIYFIYSLFITTNYISTFKYFVMWMLNISVVYFILKLKNIDKFLDFFLKFMLYSSILGVILHFSGIFYSANPFNAFNKNSYIFLVVLSLAIAFTKNKKYEASIISFCSIFIYSRTLYLMLIMGGVFFVFSKLTLKYFLYLFFISIFISILFFSLSSDSFILERIKGAFILIERLYEFYEDFDLSIGKLIDDHQRFYVIVSNIDMLVDVFPIGTGMGLENYLSRMNEEYVPYLKGGDFHRAHNYYISYLAEMGIFFFIFTYILWKPLFLNTDIYYKSLYFGMLIGIATNEYVTSPYFWILFGLIYRNMKRKELNKQ